MIDGVASYVWYPNAPIWRFSVMRSQMTWPDKRVSRSIVLSPTEAMQLARGERARESTIDLDMRERVIHVESTGELVLGGARGNVLIVAWPAAGSSCEPREANDRLDSPP